MNEIEKYRKASAEWMGLEWAYNLGDPVYRLNGVEFCEAFNWNPHTDLNQMGMIEDKLIEEGCETHCSCERLSLTKVVRYDYRIIHTETEHRAIAVDKSKPIAFMKCFMGYLDSQ